MSPLVSLRVSVRQGGVTGVKERRSSKVMVGLWGPGLPKFDEGEGALRVWGLSVRTRA